MSGIDTIDLTRPDFVWKDGDRLIAFGPSALSSLPAFLRAKNMETYVLLATERSVGDVPDASARATKTVFVPDGRVDEIAARLLDQTGNEPILAVGGGRVIDVAKAIAGTTDHPLAVVPTTLSGAPMTPFHRLPAGYGGKARTHRPDIVIALPDKMASQPYGLRTGSAMNALAHAVESTFVTTSSPVPRQTGLRAVRLLFDGMADGASHEAATHLKLALGAIQAAYAIGMTGPAVHHVTCQTIVRLAGIPHAPTYGVMLPYTLELMKFRDELTWSLVAEAAGVDQPSVLIAQLNRQAGLPTSLSEMGVSPESIDEIVAAASSRAELNLTPGGANGETVRELLEAAL